MNQINSSAMPIDFFDLSLEICLLSPLYFCNLRRMCQISQAFARNVTNLLLRRRSVHAGIAKEMPTLLSNHKALKQGQECESAALTVTSANVSPLPLRNEVFIFWRQASSISQQSERRCTVVDQRVHLVDELPKELIWRRENAAFYHNSAFDDCQI